MRVKHLFCVLTTAESWAKIWSFQCDGSVVVYSLLLLPLYVFVCLLCGVVLGSFLLVKQTSCRGKESWLLCGFLCSV